jgi:hypothetical protein
MSEVMEQVEAFSRHFIVVYGLEKRDGLQIQDTGKR